MAIHGRSNQTSSNSLCVTQDVPLVDRAKLDYLEGGTHEETLRPQVNPKVKGREFEVTRVLSRLLKDSRVR